ncbi:MAG: arginase [Mariprofundaceae bacterium]
MLQNLYPRRDAGDQLIGQAFLAPSRRCELIGAAWGCGAADARCGEGPASLRDGGMPRRLREKNIRTEWRAIAAPLETDAPVMAQVVEGCGRLAREVAGAMADGALFGVIGGDHSCAIGAWSAAACTLRRRGSLGLIWFDAHMDSHTFATSPSGMWHGMPLACLLGHGPDALTGLAGSEPAIAPRHVCLIGVRSFEDEERKLLDGLCVRVFFMDEVRDRGLAPIMQDALDIAGRRTAGFGISIDLDGIDPRDAPAVGSPVAGGLHRGPVLRTLAWLGREPHLLGVEIAEFNPWLDEGGKTARLIEDMLLSVTGGAP